MTMFYPKVIMIVNLKRNCPAAIRAPSFDNFKFFETKWTNTKMLKETEFGKVFGD